MQEAAYFYVSKFWIAPAGKAALMRWLDNGHVAEVVSQPGFLWCRQIDLHEKDADGCESYMMIYALESEEHFKRYKANEKLAAKFAEQRKDFAHHLRMDRWDGAVVGVFDRPA
ncbi:MAG: DUF4286 family protein [Pseudomonadota bacterium]